MIAATRETSHTAARILVDHLYAQSFPPIPGIDVGTAYVLAEDNLRVGGDLIDIYKFNNGSVAISLGAGRPSGFHASSLEFFVETLAATALLSVLIYGFYRNSAYLAKWIGATGTTIVVRLSAFLLFCIGIQVAWNGLSELLATLSFSTVS